MGANQFSLLFSRRLFPLFATQFLGAFNDNVFKNALVILITYQLAANTTFSSEMLVTLAAGIFIFPFFLFSATAGQLADKYEKSKLIRITKVIEIILTLFAAFGFYLKSVELLMIALFLLGVQATLFGPLKYSILPNLLAKEELLAGNGLIEAGTFVAILLGTIMGGIVVLFPMGEYQISVAIFIIAIVGLWASFYIPNTHIENKALTINYNVLTETYRVVNYSRGQRDLLIAILGISWFWLVGAVYLAEFPVFARNILNANQYVVTLFFCTFSIGIAIGSLLCNTLLKGRVTSQFVPAAALGMMIFGVDLYFSAHQISTNATEILLTPWQFLQYFHGWHVVIDLLLVSICGGLYTVPLYAILQQRSVETHRARVIASNNVINALFMVAASVVTMLMLKLQFTVLDIFLYMACLNVLVAFLIRKFMPN